MTGLFVLLLWAHLAAFVVFAIAVTEIDRWREWHHVYIGLALGAVGWVLAAAAPPEAFVYAGVALLLLGAWIAWDDALAHARQAQSSDYKLKAARLHPGPYGGLDRPYSWWHRLAHRRGVI